jgi:hypothetical protein
MEIKIVKLKVRRGSNIERKSVILDQGEIVYTIDTKRLFVGNGVLSGGDVVGNKNFLPLTQYNSLSTLNGEIGDIATVNSIFYQLTALPANVSNNWVPLFTSNTISLSSLSASQINPLTVNNGLIIADNRLQTDLNSKFFQISANKISIRIGGIDQREISSSSFGNGISGGSGLPISLNVDPTYFSFASNRLTLNTLPTSATISDVDELTITNTNGTISQTSITTPSTFEVPKIDIDEYGRVSNIESSIFDTLTGFDAINPIFNGTPMQSLSGGIPGLTLTTLSAISASDTGTSVIVLSSAGFLVFEGNEESRNGPKFGRYAIPIYTY